MWSMYSGTGKIFSKYWGAYGGAQALFRSPYLHLAVLMTAVTFNTWKETAWWADVIATLPNVLGFTLGGLAIFISFGDEEFRSLLADPDDDETAVDWQQRHSMYVGLCASFVHFILVQALALLIAFIAKALHFDAPWLAPWAGLIKAGDVIVGAIGYLVFLYALTSVVSVTMHVFRIATMYEQYRRSVANDRGHK